MSIFISKQILRAPGDSNAGGWQLLLSLPPWDDYRTTPWTRRKAWCLTLLIFCRDFPCLSTSRDPWPHKEREQLSCAGDGKHCILLALCLINTACQSQRQLHPMTSFLGPHAMPKAVILFFLLPYLGFHRCHLPLKRANDFLYAPNVFSVSVQINCIGIWFTHSKTCVQFYTFWEIYSAQWRYHSQLSFFKDELVYTICIK